MPIDELLAKRGKKLLGDFFDLPPLRGSLRNAGLPPATSTFESGAVTGFNRLNLMVGLGAAASGHRVL